MPRRQKSPEIMESSDDESPEEIISMGEIEDRLFKMDMDFGEMKVETTVMTDIQTLIDLQRKLTEKVRRLLTEVRQHRTPTELKMVMQRAMHIVREQSNVICERIKEIKQHRRADQLKSAGDSCAQATNSMITVLEENMMARKGDKFYEPIVFNGDATQFPLFQKTLIHFIEAHKIPKEIRARVLRAFLGEQPLKKVMHIQEDVSEDWYELVMKELDLQYSARGAMQRQVHDSLKRMNKIKIYELEEMQYLQAKMNIVLKDLKRHPEQHLSFDMNVILQKTPIELTSKLTKMWDFDTTSKRGSVTGLQCLADLLQGAIDNEETLRRYGIRSDTDPNKNKNEKESEHRVAQKTVKESHNQEKRGERFGRGRFGEMHKGYDPRSFGKPMSQSTRKGCLCEGKENHVLTECLSFKTANLEQKELFLSSEKRCPKCLEEEHSDRDCAEDLRCELCGGRHHIIMHRTIAHTNVTTREPLKLKEGEMSVKPDINVDEPLLHHMEENGIRFSRFETAEKKTRQAKTVLDLMRALEEVTLKDVEISTVLPQDGSATLKEVSESEDEEDTQKGRYVHAVHRKPKVGLMRLMSFCGMALPIRVYEDEGSQNYVWCIALIDTQSDCTFIREDLAECLNLVGIETSLSLSTINDTRKEYRCQVLNNLSVRGSRSEPRVSLNGVHTTELIPTNEDHFPERVEIEMSADLATIREQFIDVPEDLVVGMLLGYDNFHAIKTTEAQISEHGASYRTPLGWVYFGEYRVVGSESDEEEEKRNCNKISSEKIREDEDLYLSNEDTGCGNMRPSDILQVLDQDFRDIDDTSRASLEDYKFMEAMEDGIQVDESNNITIPLPFNDKVSELRNNYKLVIGRLQGLKRKLELDRSVKESYDTFMNEMISSGYARLLSREEAANVNFLIPHHPVWKDGKIRIVFDCSAKYRGFSINDALMKGPNLNNDLMATMLRFRQYRYAVTCDIKKMFLQFRVTKEDETYLGFLWYPEGNLNSAPRIYSMTRHAFGLRSSPNVCIYGLKKIAEIQDDSVDNRVVKFLTEQFLRRRWINLF